MTFPRRRLVIVCRADPVISGHSGEARNLAEVALTRGFDDVRLLTWPMEALETAGLPLKPVDRLLPYSSGITVERPGPIGDYRVPDGRYIGGLTGRLVELLAEPVPTVCLSMYLAPHADVVINAVTSARAAGLRPQVRTIAKAVGSDVTNVIRNALREGRSGVAITLFTTFLANDDLVAVSEYTRHEIVACAQDVDRIASTSFAGECRRRVVIGYPPIDTSAYLDLDPCAVDAALARRGLERDGYLLFLSRICRAKGVYDLIAAFTQARCRNRVKLVIAGRGPALEHVQALAREDERIIFLTDVDDDEKPLLMNGCAAFTLPTKPEPDFVETFGIALVEKMLSGGGPVITTITGGTGEAVGDTAIVVEAGNVNALTEAMDRAVLSLTASERETMARRAREYAMAFDRARVFDSHFPAGHEGPGPAVAGGLDDDDE